MSHKVLIVKNMVCHRCVLAVEAILKQMAIPFDKVLFGEIHLLNDLSAEQKSILHEKLAAIGFDIIDDHAGALVEKIRSLVIRKARNEVNEDERVIKLSNFLSDGLRLEYTYLSSLFSSVEGRTIENFFIEQRIEKAKELLVYGEKTLSQIAFELDHSSVAHLSNQFKKVTGLTPSYFKQIGASKRRSLDSI